MGQRSRKARVFFFGVVSALVIGSCVAELQAGSEKFETFHPRKAKGVSAGKSSAAKSGVGSSSGKTRFSTPKTYTASNFNVRTPTYSATPRIRPFYIVLLLGVGVSGTHYHRQCPNDHFRFGSSCRACSATACPIGQYRVECSPHNDAYCTACTNKPEGNTRYTEPGNENDCAWEECDGVCPVITTTNEAVVTVDVLVPVEDAGFPAVEEGVKEGIASVAQVEGTSIFFAERVENSHEVVRKAPKRQPGELQQAQRRLLQDDNAAAQDENAAETQNTTNAQEVTGNLTMGDVNLTTIEAWSCSQAIPEHDKYVQVSVEISTTEDQVSQMWDRLTAFALAEEMADRCLPPVLLQYQVTPTTGAANARKGGSWLLLLGALLLLWPVQAWQR